jgi:putative transposase
MDGKGRAIDNIYIERFWRTIKQELIYLNNFKDGLVLYQSVDSWIKFYNTDRIHLSIKSTPELIYLQSQSQTA